MRNKITLIDPNIPTLTIFQLTPGEMFNYTNKQSDGAYMKLDGFGTGNAAIYLPTGMYYLIKEDAPLHKLTNLQISSPIS